MELLMGVIMRYITDIALDGIIYTPGFMKIGLSIQANI
jgi:hypothetical protein